MLRGAHKLLISFI